MDSFKWSSACVEILIAVKKQAAANAIQGPYPFYRVMTRTTTLTTAAPIVRLHQASGSVLDCRQRTVARIACEARGALVGVVQHMREKQQLT
jgi:hypothetical protein